MPKVVLNAGSGYSPLNYLPYADETFDGWLEVRFDCDPKTKPHVVGDITDMKNIKSESVDAVFSCHTLEHIYTSQVPVALNNFYRVIKDGGFLALYIPDFGKIIEALSSGTTIDHVVYESDIGPIRLIDIVFGLEGAIYECPPMMHKTAFTHDSIQGLLKNAGFVDINVTFDVWDMWIIAHKVGHGQ